VGALQLRGGRGQELYLNWRFKLLRKDSTSNKQDSSFKERLENLRKVPSASRCGMTELRLVEEKDFSLRSKFP